VFHRNQIQIIPVVYKYIKGHLKIPVSIFFPEKIDQISSFSQIVIMIPSRKESVELHCQPQIEQVDLDEVWKLYQKQLLKYFPEFNNKIFKLKPSLRKHVLIDLKPNRITGIDAEGVEHTYDMEIL
jgi:hypothetical protein